MTKLVRGLPEGWSAGSALGLSPGPTIYAAIEGQEAVFFAADGGITGRAVPDPAVSMATGRSAAIHRPRRVHVQTEILTPNDGGAELQHRSASRAWRRSPRLDQPADRDHPALATTAALSEPRSRRDVAIPRQMALTRSMRLASTCAMFYYVCGGTQDNNSLWA
jgi:hypothetical protein